MVDEVHRLCCCQGQAFGTEKANNNWKINKSTMKWLLEFGGANLLIQNRKCLKIMHLRFIKVIPLGFKPKTFRTGI